MPSLTLHAARRIGAMILAALAAAGCRPQAVAPCGLDRTFQVVCGIERPEDLALLKGTPWVIVSQAEASSVRGPFALIDTRSLRLQAPELDLGERALNDLKGDPACEPALPRPRFRGIDVRADGGGRFRIAGISGAEVQRIELYDAVADSTRVAVTWVGCVEVPRSYFLNDVALGPNGELFATHMFTRDEGLRRILRFAYFLIGDETGYAVAWSPETGWRRMRNSGGSYPNGIAADPNGGAFYMTSTYRSTISRISTVDGTRKDLLLPVRPDNVTWSDTGALIVAGGNGFRLISTLGCGELSKPGCGYPSGVVEVDATSSKQHMIFDNDGIKIPGASVAVLTGNALFLGSDAADRVTVVEP
jgi:hypothetical protein